MRQLTRSITLSLALCAVFMTGYAWGDTPAPELQISDEIFQFGRVTQDAKVSHLFWLKNIGDDTLKITDVKPGCGCTKAPLDTHELAAGDSTSVKVTFSTGHYHSRVTKSARVISNAPGPEQLLRFAADVRTGMDSLDVFRVSPPAIDLDENPSGERSMRAQYDLTLTNTSDQPLRFAVVSVSDEDVSIDLPESFTVEPGAKRTIPVRFAEDLSGAVFQGSFTLEASDGEHTRVTVPYVKSRRWGPAQMSDASDE